MTRPITQRLAQITTAGAVTAFAAGLARHHPDPSTAIESGFLALVLGITFAALALSQRTASAVVPGGALIALALSLPAAEGTRGALVMFLLVATLGFATWRICTSERRIAWLDFAALAIAWQAVARSERLLEWEGLSARSLVWLLALPLATAAAAWWHARAHGATNTVVLFAATIALTPGLGVVPVAVLVASAALTGKRGRSWQAALVAAAACAAAIWWLPAVGPTLVVLAAALALRHHTLGAWLPVVGALGWALASMVTTSGSFTALGWLLLGLPFAALAPAASRPLLLAALALALTHPPDAAPELLAPAVALAALSMPRERWARRAQAAWSLVLLSLVAVAAAYPWLRQPLAEAPVDYAPLALGVLAVSLAYLALQASGRWPRLGWGALMALLGSILVVAAVRQPQRLNVEPILLTALDTTWQAPLPANPVRSLSVDSLVNGSQSLRPGQIVAHVLLTSQDGSQQWLALRFGRHTGDWAARRLAAGLAPAPPPPWLTWYAGDGSLAQRYRGSWRLDEPLTLESLAVVRAANLAPEVELTILAVASR